MHQLSLRPLRTLALVAAFAGATATAATPAVAKTGGTAKSTTKKATKKTVKKAKKTAGKPDLVARGLTLDFADDGIALSARIANVGSKRARGSDVTVAISTDTTFSDDAIILEDIAVPKMQAGVERTVSTDVDIPEDLPEGDLYLVVCADGNEELKEKDEANNCTSQLIASADDDTPVDADDDASPADQSNADDSSDDE